MRIAGRSFELPILPVLGLVLVPIATAIYLAILVQPFTTVTAADASATTAGSHRAAAIWGASFVFYMTAAVWNIMVARLIAQRYLRLPGQWLVLGAAAVAACVGFRLRESSYASDVAPLSLIVNGDVPIYDVTSIGNAITAAVIVLLVASCGALMYRRRREELTARNLRRRIGMTRLSLYSAAALLIVGVVQIYLLNDWPSHVFTGTSPESRKGLHELAYTAGVVSGALYSAMLLMLYVPVLLTHDKWVSKLAENAISRDPSTDLSKWRETQGLGRSAAATVVEIGAVVGPWLAAIGLPQLILGA